VILLSSSFSCFVHAWFYMQAPDVIMVNRVIYIGMTFMLCYFYLRYFVTKAITVSLLLTFISVLDVPVYWCIYLCYWIFLFMGTMKRQIVHMIKYKYNPFTLGCQ